MQVSATGRAMVIGTINIGVGAGAGAVGGVVQSGVDKDHNMLGDVKDGALIGSAGGAISGGLATGPIGKPTVNGVMKAFAWLQEMLL